MNSASIRKSTVALCSVVRVAANRVPNSSCESVSKTSTVLPSCYSTVWSFRSSRCLWCLVEARRNYAIEVGSPFSRMSGRNSKNNRKGGKNQGRGQSNNVSPDTDKSSPGKSRASNVETCSAASESKSPKEKSQTEAASAEKSTESKAVSEMNPATDNKPESPAVGSALSLEKEKKIKKSETTDEKSPLKSMTKEEALAKHDVKEEENVTLTSSVSESNVKGDVKEDKNKERNETPKQSHSKAVDHEGRQPSDKTEDNMMVRNQPELANNESKQVKDNKDAAEIESSSSVMVLTDSSDSNSGSPSKESSISASDKGKTTPKSGSFAKDARRQEGRTYYGTRQSTVMQEKETFLAMTREEKRRFYGKKDFVTLDDIDTWKDFYCKHAKPLKKMYPDADQMKTAFRGNSPKFEADDEINAKISVFEGDITTIEIDGIVNAANSSLLGGGGVDGAIHRAAGSQLVEECKTLNGCRTGDAKTTCGYKLPAKYVIHTVGPQGTYPQDLRSCYTRCLDEMLKHNMRSIAFCCISTGIYGYPNEQAVHVALNIIREWLNTLKKKNQLNLVDRVIFCLFMRVDIRLYQSWMQVYFPLPGENDADKNVPEETKDNKVSSDADCPAKEGKDEPQLKYSTCVEESASMEIEEIPPLEEAMDAEDGTANANRVGGAQSPDKKCKLDPDATSSATVKMDMC